MAGKLDFTWTNDSGSGNALATDIAFVAVFCEPLSHWIYSQQTGAVRSAGTYSLDVSAFSGKPVHTYLGLVNVL